MFEKLREMTGGDPSRMKLYLETYSTALEENLPKLALAIETNDHNAIRTVAHTIKPLFTIMGLTELWEKANTIETNIDSRTDLDSIEELAREFLLDMEQSTPDNISE